MVYGIPFFVLFAFTLSLAFLISKVSIKIQKVKQKMFQKGLWGTLSSERHLVFSKHRDKIRVLFGWKNGYLSMALSSNLLIGVPTVFVIGQAGNKFVLGSPDDVLSSKKPLTLRKILGRQSIVELTGPRYRLVKGEMLKFLKPECLQNYVKRMDELVNATLLREFRENETIGTVVFMKKLSYEIACHVLFDIKDEHTKEALFVDFTLAFKAIHSLPINRPGTTFWRGQRARARIVDRMIPIMNKRREELSKGVLSSTNDMLSCLLALKDENHQPLDDDLIIDNFIFLFVASHDTSATLMNLMIWKLSRDQEVYNKVLEEQMEIIKQREGTEERLTWEEIQKMKYTWRVAQELMRMIPPFFGSFRKALKDTNYKGYDIPKGWQVYWAAYGTHMNDDIFENPYKFDPSRFENPTKPIPPYSYIPFGAGLHYCIGNEFARIETLAIIHNFVKMYEWSQVNPEESITRQPMPYPSMGLPIKIKPRCCSIS